MVGLHPAFEDLLYGHLGEVSSAILGARTEKSIDEYLPCLLRDGGTSRVVCSREVLYDFVWDITLECSDRNPTQIKSTISWCDVAWHKDASPPPTRILLQDIEYSSFNGMFQGVLFLLYPQNLQYSFIYNDTSYNLLFRSSCNVVYHFNLILNTSFLQHMQSYK